MKVPIFHKIDFLESDGPFEDLYSLRRKSTIYRNLVLRNPKRAQQICEERNIDVMKDFVFTEEDVSVSKDFIELIEHCTKGKVSKGKISGIHFYDEKHVKILKVLEKNNVNGVFEAEIEYFDLNSNRWTEKEKSTTFFPLSWSLNKLFHECLFAVNNKQKKENSENVYVSKTESGIEVEIIKKQGLLKSIYPLL
ncbi:EndoU domain-containing protein [Arenibacter certesii]|uniref:Bacterial EndoU nuclease domain-containing protein n=1 Tax=Arenibacter certesii TaxID=228955 RepID=A0A918MMM9_9FLAO|nr:EndoU domain-containing protein [Arenibacter certesii]GGW39173.1 hypothetical protein GCM10007383_24870 [Arenibacter certesii]